MPLRHQTLRATLDWSHELLNDSERRMLRRLAVFPSRFEIEAAEEVCSGNGLDHAEALDVLESLISRSLVNPDAAEGVSRHRLPESVRAYALEKLDQSGEASNTRSAHANFFHDMARQWAAALFTPRIFETLEEMDNALEDLRLTLQHHVACGEAERACSVAVALGYYCLVRGTFDEGLRWAEAALEVARPGKCRSLPVLSFVAGVLASRCGDGTASMRHLRETIAEARELDDEATLARGLVAAAESMPDGGLAALPSVLPKALAAAERSGSVRAIVECLQASALVEIASHGRVDSGISMLERALELARGSGDPRLIAGSAATLAGELSAFRQQRARVGELLAEARAIPARLDDRPSLSRLLVLSGDVALRQGQTADARRLAEEARSIAREIGYQQQVQIADALLDQVARHEEVDPEQRRARFREYVAELTAAGNSLDLVLTLFTLAEDELRDGRLADAREALEEVREAARGAGVEVMAVAAIGALAQIAYLDGELEGAHRYALEGMQLAEDVETQNDVLLTLRSLLGDIARAEGRLEEVREHQEPLVVLWASGATLLLGPDAALMGAVGNAVALGRLHDGARILAAWRAIKQTSILAEPKAVPLSTIAAVYDVALEQMEAEVRRQLGPESFLAVSAAAAGLSDASLVSLVESLLP
jgi:tetratricopeptide (TPR) repeat protein